MESAPACIFANANVITMDRDRRRARALAVEHGRVVACGILKDVRSTVAAGAKTFDLQGLTVIPGFNDCHMHILPFGLGLDQVDISPAACTSIEDVVSALSKSAVETRDGRWVRGRGYNHDFLRDRRHPTCEDLDRVSTTRPVLVSHTSGHVVCCNSVALKTAGIDGNTPTPAGGEIEHDDRGMPTGVLKETAMHLVTQAVPPPTHTELRDAILRAMRQLVCEGITSASDAMTGHELSAQRESAAYLSALESGRMAGRVVLMPQIMYVAPADSDAPVLVPSDFDVGHTPEHLRIGAVKIFADGAITTRTAALRTPYDARGDSGLPTWEPSDLHRMVARTHAAGWQIATHAMGDCAIEMVLDAYEDAQAAKPGRDPRHRIEHCSLPDEHLTRRMRVLGVVPVVQPELIARFGDSYVAGLGFERASNAMPIRWFSNNNIDFGLSSDRPVVPGSPLAGVCAAMQRHTPGGRVLGEVHRLSAEQALHHYTAGSAYATFTEKEKGTLSPRLLADFVVLDRDITRVPAEEIPAVRVVMSVVGGEIVYGG